MSALFSLMSIITAGAALAGALVYWREARPGVFVLLYHRLRSEADYATLTGPERNFSIPIGHFVEQMQWLTEQGYTFLGADELADVLGGRIPVPRRAVAVTFDDGSQSVLTLGWPVLRERGQPATVFVTTDPAAWVFEDQPRLTDEELRTLHAQGMSVGAHGVSHHGLDRMSPAARDAELVNSRDALEAIVGSPVRDMAIPLNFYDDAVITAAGEAGYRMVCTANPGRARAGDDPLRVRRIAVEGQMSLAEFVRNLSPRSLLQRRVVGWLKRLPPRLLGETRWMPLRRRLFLSPLGRWLTFRHLRVAVLAAAGLWLAALVWVGALTFS